jgi:predicted branched-subunit amino acid permease
MPHVGKRGRVLLFFGALDLVYAVSLARPDATARRIPMFIWLTEIAPLWVWSVIWAAVGAVCLWQAFCHRDAIGFAAAISSWPEPGGERGPEWTKPSSSP